MSTILNVFAEASHKGLKRTKTLAYYTLDFITVVKVEPIRNFGVNLNIILVS
jgi:hypothetical protein